MKPNKAGKPALLDIKFKKTNRPMKQNRVQKQTHMYKRPKGQNGPETDFHKTFIRTFHTGQRRQHKATGKEWSFRKWRWVDWMSTQEKSQSTSIIYRSQFRMDGKVKQSFQKMV